MSSGDHQSISSDAPHIPGTRLLHSVLDQFPSFQTRRGDRKLERARKIAEEFEPIISRGDRQIIKERIFFAEDVKFGLDSTWGFSKFSHAREYRRAARDACQFAKTASARGLDPANTALFNRVMSVAKPLYRCYLTCHDAFPAPDMKDDLLDYVWCKACGRTRVDPCSLASPHVDEIVVSSTTLLSDMKTKIMHLVESSYGFDTSRAPDSISRNAELAHALLTKKSFICREPNIDGTPQHPYRHPIIQEAINMIWFQSENGDGIVFHEHFMPISIQTISLVLTVIECCLNEWKDGTRNVSDWDEDRYGNAYYSHISFLSDFRDRHDTQDEVEDLSQIQNDILTNARVNAGVPHEPVTGSGKLSPDAVVDENLPAPYDGNGNPIPTFSISFS